jgi:adenosylcobinamide kinase/adenosylcobinamide-phosphate guanylyltransferase
MPLVLLIGGARAGKSRLAVQLAAAQPAPVVFLATGEPGDDEMRVRIADHRRERPAHWQTIEEPLELGQALAAADPDSCLVVDCLTLWVANALAALGPAAVEREAANAATAAAARPGATIAVSNEVGLGIVPDNALARTYRDVLGRVNAAWADAADRSFLVVAGQTVALVAAPSAVELLRG